MAVISVRMLVGMSAMNQATDALRRREKRPLQHSPSASIPASAEPGSGTGTSAVKVETLNAVSAPLTVAKLLLKAVAFVRATIQKLVWPESTFAPKNRNVLPLDQYPEFPQQHRQHRHIECSGRLEIGE